MEYVIYLGSSYTWLESAARITYPSKRNDGCWMQSLQIIQSILISSKVSFDNVLLASKVLTFNLILLLF